ncbi:QmoA [Desulfamplus magnetovallimortis]|uniref:QmoA n=1 Tax=Desulfamplus magnetovallimortis TaxID=1246637 RepID=A0A1W1HGH6_9BACT|nr:CoB--CoM heterodisulfide reductase iron-sulfur subunit A family protein [Desulfamplus magnetovallimortis]SLM31523.1 QmoA [Desulfamplus magnetovallimortis]
MTTDKSAPAGGSIMVVGGGISGLTTALEAAEVGYEVLLIEKEPSLGGRVSQLKQYFPKLCPPTCGLEINYKRVKDNPRIKVITMAEVEKVEGNAGNYTVEVKISPRYVNENCTACGECAKVCESEISNEFNFGMDRRKAAYLPHNMAFPMRYVMAPSMGADDREKCKEACKYDAIDFDMQEKTLDFKVGAIVWATGWKPYDAARIDNLGFGRYQNIITNMMLERMASLNGPTQGKILRPSDDKAPETIAFAQCAGSRDENHLPYCSYICCMASLKHATYLREQYPDAKIYIYYIDLRTPGRKYENFYSNLKKDENVFFIKGKVAEVGEESGTGNVTLVAEDTLSGEKIRQTVDMLVLATGMQPNASVDKPNADLKYNADGFIVNDFKKGGMFAAGCANKPADVVTSNQNATGMALKAIQTLVRR